MGFNFLSFFSFVILWITGKLLPIQSPLNSPEPGDDWDDWSLKIKNMMIKVLKESPLNAIYEIKFKHLWQLRYLIFSRTDSNYIMDFCAMNKRTLDKSGIFKLTKFYFIDKYMFFSSFYIKSLLETAFPIINSYLLNLPFALICYLYS